MTRLGVTLPAVGVSLSVSRDLAREAEDLGYTDIWTAEVSGTDAFSVCSVLGVSTKSMRIGVAIVPVFSRPPALLAMSAAAAQDACGGRFCLGIGASTPTIVERWMGESFDKPLSRIRETVDVVRRALTGEKVDLDGKTVKVKGFRLEAPSPEVPIFLAALGPKMMKLASEVSDGIVLFATDETGVRIAKDACGDKEIIGRLIVAPGLDADEARQFGRWLLPPYIAAPGYNPWIARQGYEAEADAVASAWNSGDRDGARKAVSDKLVDALVLHGAPGAIKERVASFYEAGLSTPIFMLISQEGPDGVRKAIKDLAPG